MNRLFIPALGAIAFALSTTQAHAQPIGSVTAGVRSIVEARNAYDDARQPYYESRRAAYDNGYREGLREGEQDGRRRSSYRYQDNRTWQRGDKGYNRSFGDIDRYRQQFRAGFSEGYQAGYGRYGQSGSYGNGRAVPRQDPYYGDRGYGGGGYGAGRYGPGYSNGVNDGVEKGREDARKRRSFDPLRHEWYRDGDRHYRREYGAKQQYENVYRQGFKEGYERGYRELGYIR